MPLELDLFFLFLQWSKTAYPMLLIIFGVTNTYLNPNNNSTFGRFSFQTKFHFVPVIKGVFSQPTNFTFSSPTRGRVAAGSE